MKVKLDLNGEYCSLTNFEKKHLDGTWSLQFKDK